MGLRKTKLWALFSRLGIHAASPGFHGNYISILPWVPGLPMVPTNTHSEEHSSPPEFCDSHHSTTPHHKNHGALQPGQEDSHKPWGGRVTDRCCPMLLLVPSLDVHLPIIPQVEPQCTRTKDDDSCLELLSYCQYCPDS